MNDSERQVRQMIDQIPALAWSCRPDGSGEFLNKQWLDYTGHSTEVAPGLDWEYVVHPDDFENLMYQLGNSSWWYVARRELAVQLLKNEINGQNSVRILDVGCGTGTNVSAFAHLAPTVGVDASMDALHFCQTRGINELSLSPVEKLPFSL
jgi:PAS domain-containing protein